MTFLEEYKTLGLFIFAIVVDNVVFRVYNEVIKVERSESMYRFKNKEDFKVYNQTNAAKVIGVTRQYLSNVINGKVNCSKLVAYCITKFIDYNKEIEDFFERV